ncbi:MAG TPA: polysaccharide deacetylase family protein [Candidatus Dormibacteraeota bacterium]|nr:polysaccharide deacetylase family protein [Candidatus Dormibacteraeota bacterium]
MSAAALRTVYSPIAGRARLEPPAGTRIIVHVIVNVEEWRFDQPMPRTAISPPQGGAYIPDVPNWAWGEYGMRVGFWRFLDVLSAHGVKCTLSINANVCNVYPQLVKACVDADWEMMGHSFYQRPLMMEQDERGVIRRTLDVIQEKTGLRPRGWLGPGLGETFDTPDHLAAEGLEYVCDWGPMDDQPVEIATKHGSLVAVPYPIDMNDIVIYVMDRHASDELYERGRRQFDWLYKESADNVRVMSIAIHPYVSGVPHRIASLERLLAHMAGHEGVTFMKAGEILDWYRGARPRA